MRRTFSDLWVAWPWRPIPGCPGRFCLAVANRRLALETLVGNTPCERHRVRGARDEVVIARLGEGGVISYARTDGTILHTLNTADGFSRKVRKLGIE